MDDFNGWEVSKDYFLKVSYTDYIIFFTTFAISESRSLKNAISNFRRNNGNLEVILEATGIDDLLILLDCPCPKTKRNLLTEQEMAEINLLILQYSPKTR